MSIPSMLFGTLAKSATKTGAKDVAKGAVKDVAETGVKDVAENDAKHLAEKQAERTIQKDSIKRSEYGFSRKAEKALRKGKHFTTKKSLTQKLMDGVTNGVGNLTQSNNSQSRSGGLLNSLGQKLFKPKNLLGLAGSAALTLLPYGDAINLAMGVWTMAKPALKAANKELEKGVNAVGKTGKVKVAARKSVKRRYEVDRSPRTQSRTSMMNTQRKFHHSVKHLNDNQTKIAKNYSRSFERASHPAPKKQSLKNKMAGREISL